MVRGGLCMPFKRQEGFRFSFGNPLEASFLVLANGKSQEVEGVKETCKVLDVSPRGMKIQTDVILSNYAATSIQLEVYFSLDSAEIKALADVVWTKPYGANFQYGLVFEKQPIVEDLIVEELKIRRRKEINRAKVKNSGL